MQGNRPGVKPFVLAMARRGVRRANAGAEGINRRQFFAPEGDLDVPSGFAKNGDAHVVLLRRSLLLSLWGKRSVGGGRRSRNVRVHRKPDNSPSLITDKMISLPAHSALP